MDFRDFVTAIASELRDLSASPAGFAVSDDSTSNDRPGFISIGRGRQADPGEPIASGVYPIALNNKEPGAYRIRAPAQGAPARPVSSVTRYVHEAPRDTIDRWRDILRTAGHDRPFLRGLAINADDASPDSCFGLLIFLALMHGVEAGQIPKAWTDYIDRWERGHTAPSLTPIGYGELHNALTHASVDIDIRAAWIDGLSLLCACIGNDLDPAAIDLTTADPVLARAGAHTRFERMAYEQVRDALPRLQLELPLAADPKRRMLVDAVFAEERVLMGSHKTYLRADHGHSFLGRGYTCFALHRPDEAGTGFDITVSLDPSSGLWLVDLWTALEEEEERAWNGSRPRAGAKAAPGGDATAPEQSWYINGDRTLVAAPRGLADGRNGTRLSWNDVLECLWRTYHPFRNARIVATASNMILARRFADEELCALEACPGEQQALPGSRVLKMGRWHRLDNTVSPLRWSPTLGRCLAASLARRGATAGALSIADVMDAPPHDHLVLEEGIAVVSEHGAFVLANDVGSGLAVREMKAVFEVGAEVMDWIDLHTQRVSELVGIARRHLARERGLRLDSHLEIYNEICRLQLRIVELRHRLDTGTTDRSAQRFRDAIMANWGVEGRLDTLYRDLDKVKTIFTSHSELLTNRRISVLTYFGFPIVLAAGLFSFVFSGIPRWNWPPTLEGIHWLGLIAFVLFAAMGVVVMYVISYVFDRWSRVTYEDEAGPRRDAEKGG